MKHGFRLIRSRSAVNDLRLIRQHLYLSHRHFGNSSTEAAQKAIAPIDRINDEMASLALAPFQGTLDDFILPGLRHVTRDRAIVYFVVDEAAKTVHVLAVFFGGQDHRRHMLERMLGRV